MVLRSYSSDESEVTIKYKRKTFSTNLYYGIKVKASNGDIVFVRGGMSARPKSWADSFCVEKGYDSSIDFVSEKVPYNDLVGKTVLRATGVDFKETFIPFNAVDLLKGRRYNAAIRISKNHRARFSYTELPIEVNECIEHLLYMPKISKITCEKAIILN